MSATASIAGLTAVAGQAAYSASKGGIISIVRTLAYELVSDHIRVNCVCPGLVQTDMEAVLHDVLPVEGLKRLHERHVLGLGTVDDVAYATAFLLSPSERWITGTSLIIDGGYTA